MQLFDDEEVLELIQGLLDDWSAGDEIIDQYYHGLVTVFPPRDCWNGEDEPGC